MTLSPSRPSDVIGRSSAELRPARPDRPPLVLGRESRERWSLVLGRDEARERRSVESRESGGTSITPSRAARRLSAPGAAVEAESGLA